MTTASPALAPSTTPVRRVAWASMVGTSLESFDFYVFAYFSAYFAGPAFFTPLGQFGGSMLAFSTIALAFVVRPIGAIIFGHMGDRLGRRATLLWTVGIMGVATGLIGLLPTYAQAGWFGAWALVVLRIVQGLSLGGEWGGSILLATEHSGRVKRAFYAAIPQLGSPVGSTLTAAAFLIMAFTLSPEQIVAWGWRIPFLLAIPMLLISLYLRFSIDETPVFKEVVAEKRRDRVPFVTMFRNAPTAFLLAVGAALLGIGSYSLMNTYTLNYGSEHLGYDYMQLTLATTIGALVQFVTIPLFGMWATRIGSAKVVMWGALGTLVIAFPMYFLLQSATFAVLVGMMIIGGILPTAAWAALGGLMNDLFPDHFRYSALSIAYAIAATLSGFVPLITLELGKDTSYAWWHPGIVLAVMSVVTLVCAWLAARRPRVPESQTDEAPAAVAA
ncbi:MFS transporter [Microbacterium sp. ASV49]|uniref:MFS transporter n=1 Tax=Microbacterium candidum TaxID=3041922 RepID=A0ABT7MYR7_9MICO|nr:MFS transporter [Microbacterium sp. ASV49]MDL9979595.1 MFS transporter [Microbacterium sp. ASV49]